MNQRLQSMLNKWNKDFIIDQVIFRLQVTLGYQVTLLLQVNLNYQYEFNIFQMNQRLASNQIVFGL